MLKSILIGLDGSPSSEAAVELGIQWAKPFKALLVGLGIVDEATIRTPEAEPIGGGYYKYERDEELVKETRRKIQQFLEQFGTRCADADISFNLLQNSGMPYEEILRESQRYDLVLFGHETHFRFGTVDRPDETLWNVLKRGPRPVVIWYRSTRRDGANQRQSSDDRAIPLVLVAAPSTATSRPMAR